MRLMIGRVAFGDRLALFHVLLDALALAHGIDNGAIGFLLVPEHQAADYGTVALDLGRRLLFDDLPDVRVHIDGAGGGQQGCFAGSNGRRDRSGAGSPVLEPMTIDCAWSRVAGSCGRGAPGAGGRRLISGGMLSGAWAMTWNSSGAVPGQAEGLAKRVAAARKGQRDSQKSQSSQWVMTHLCLLLRRCFTLFLAPEQSVQHEHGDADENACIRQVEGRPLAAESAQPDCFENAAKTGIGFAVEPEEIEDACEAQAVEDIAEGAADDEAEGDGGPAVGLPR